MSALKRSAAESVDLASRGWVRGERPGRTKQRTGGGGCVGALTGREKEPAIRECAWDSYSGAHSSGQGTVDDFGSALIHRGVDWPSDRSCQRPGEMNFWWTRDQSRADKKKQTTSFCKGGKEVATPRQGEVRLPSAVTGSPQGRRKRGLRRWNSIGWRRIIRRNDRRRDRGWRWVGQRGIWLVVEEKNKQTMIKTKRITKLILLYPHAMSLTNSLCQFG